MGRGEDREGEMCVWTRGIGWGTGMGRDSISFVLSCPWMMDGIYGLPFWTCWIWRI